MNQKSLFSELEEAEAALPGKPAEKLPKGSKQAAPPGPIVDGGLKLEQFLCFSLYSANHAMNRVYKPILTELGLTYPQYLAMSVLWEKDKLLVGDLCDRLHLESSTVTPLLKRLEAMELLSRQRDTKDERQVRVTLTRKGKALKAKTGAIAECVLAASGLSAKEAMVLQTSIMKLRDALLKAS
ncbi:MarR family winged helix-turn-helix transcriptional regulator [Roseibium litorale]|uniref:MarR family transcriptional regulator n=1 Tax=Roseibium litorale TaxID=2803841 RepID=A0ABR9CH65_9HYPH|nr:MarR family transcriptional regulator [Roseibium litorale]MBD8890192.1 MarR family transcriptional regulator [Roseibium litorale]